MTSAEAKLRAATERTAAEFMEADLSSLRLAATIHHAAGGSRSGRLNGAGGAGGPRFRRGLAARGLAARGLAAFGAAAAMFAVQRAGQWRHGSAS